MFKLPLLPIVLFSILCLSCSSKQGKQSFFTDADTDTMQFVNVISPDVDSIQLVDDETDIDIEEKSIKEDDPYKSQTETELMTVDEQVNFWKEFKKNLLKKDYKKLADMVQYPLFGDVFRFKIYAPDYTDEQVELANSKDRNFYREDFIKNANKMFEKEFIQLLSIFDFDKASKDDTYNPTIKTADGYIHSIHFYTREVDPDSDKYSAIYYLSYNSGHPEESITEFSEIYYIRKNKEGKILLYCINGAG